MSLSQATEKGTNIWGASLLQNKILDALNIFFNFNNPVKQVLLTFKATKFISKLEYQDAIQISETPKPKHSHCIALLMWKKQHTLDSW